MHVSDPDSDPLTVTFFGRPLASGNYTQIAQNTNVTSNTDSTTNAWANLGGGQTFQWYATVKDATHTAVTGPDLDVPHHSERRPRLRRRRRHRGLW